MLVTIQISERAARAAETTPRPGYVARDVILSAAALTALGIEVDPTDPQGWGAGPFRPTSSVTVDIATTPTTPVWLRTEGGDWLSGPLDTTSDLALCAQYATPIDGGVEVSAVLAPQMAYTDCPRGAQASIEDVFPLASEEAQAVAAVFARLTSAGPGAIAGSMDVRPLLPRELWFSRAALGLSAGPTARCVAVVTDRPRATAPGGVVDVAEEGSHGSWGYRRAAVVAVLVEGQELVIPTPQSSHFVFARQPRRIDWIGAEISDTPRTLADLPEHVTAIDVDLGGGAWSSMGGEMGGSKYRYAEFRRMPGHSVAWQRRERGGSTGYGPRVVGSSARWEGDWTPAPLSTPVEDAHAT